MLLQQPTLTSRELYSRYPWQWLIECCYTLDQHDGVNPIKLFPDRAYLKEALDVITNNRLVLFKKSRQMMMTWLVSLFGLWMAMFRQGQLIFYQSKKLADAVGDENAATGPLGRAKFTYRRLPEWLQQRTPCEITSEKMIFRSNQSTIWAIPEGADIIRTHTASMIFADEAGFQPEFANAYTAAMPCIVGGGRFIGISTAEPGFFNELYEDKVV